MMHRFRLSPTARFDGAQRLKAGLRAGRTLYAMESHSALAARIVERDGFEVAWASGFSIASALGLRDRSELSHSQLLDVVQSMRDSSNIPILVDADTGYGDFNNFRLLLRRLEAMGAAGVCIEDKVFPKLNSFVEGPQTLADPDEFCGKLRAGKDARRSEDFVLVARTEALIAGAGMDEAFRRASRYLDAGADAILIHSKSLHADEILRFANLWNRRAPLVIVPTTYADTPVAVFEAAGVNLVIWANQMLRASVAAMLRISAEVSRSRSPAAVGTDLAPMQTLFDLLDYPELVRAERRYHATEVPQATSVSAPTGLASTSGNR